MLKQNIYWDGKCLCGHKPVYFVFVYYFLASLLTSDQVDCLPPPVTVPDVGDAIVPKMIVKECLSL